MFSTFTAFPVLALEILAELLLLGIALTVVIRAHRRAGLALAAGAAMVLLSQTGSALSDIAFLGFAVSRKPGPDQMAPAVIAMFLSSWLPYIGRSLQLFAVAWSLLQLVARIPPDVRDVPPDVQ